jgi:hypothetical protein
VQRDLEKLSDPVIILLVSTMMASAKDLEKPNGIVIVLLRGQRNLKELSGMVVITWRNQIPWWSCYCKCQCC